MSESYAEIFMFYFLSTTLLQNTILDDQICGNTCFYEINTINL